MKIGFLGGILPAEYKLIIEKNAKHGVSNAANNFQTSILKGFTELKDVDVTIFNSMFIGWYPRYTSLTKIPKFDFNISRNVIGKNIGFNNFLVVKEIQQKRFLIHEISKWIETGKERKVLLVYSIQIHFFEVISTLKNKYPHLHVCLITPDLLEYMSPSRYDIVNRYRTYRNKIVPKLIHNIDSFIFLTDYMSDKINTLNKPWLRIEGIYSKKEDIQFAKEGNKVILYTGTLSKRYGIMKLLDSFDLINDDRYSLWICGDGDGKEELIKRTLSDSRIIYYGTVSSGKVNELQQKATILINPRENVGDYTKFSFPSKTMEYLGSGTPALMFKLDGIPDEYDKYLFYFEANTKEYISNRILGICELPQETLIEKGKQAKQFVEKNKNHIIQTKKIYKFLRLNI